MALSSPKIFAGVHSVVFISRATKLPLGELRVIQGVELSSSIEKTPLTGGAQKAPWAVIDGASEENLTITVNEYPQWLLEVANGGTGTTIATEASGNLSSIVDAVGTTFTDAVKGITLAVDTAASLKFGRYYLKATGAQAAKLYSTSSQIASSDFVGDDLEVATLNLSATATALGIDFVPAGTVNLTTGDVAYFDVRPVGVGGYEVAFGSESAVLNEVEILAYGQNVSGQLVELHAYRAKGGGLPMNFAPNEFSELSLEFSLMYCSSRGGTHKVRTVNTGSSGTC